MKILFLDDMKSRHQSFVEQLASLDETMAAWDTWYVWNGEQALKQLAGRDFDVVFLDHDLAEDQYDEHMSGQRMLVSKALSGTEVAEAIAALPRERRPKLAVIHSWNKYGARRMAEILHAADVPYLPMMFNDKLLSTVLPYFPKII